MAEDTYYCFTVNSMIRGYHVYKDIWESPTIGDEFICKREIGNPKDPLSVAVMKLIGGENTVIGHVPRIISALCSLFIRRGGVLKCRVDGRRRYSTDLPQGGMEIQCKLIFSTRSAVDCEKLKKLVIASLSETRNQEAEYEIGGPTITKVQKNVDKADETDSSKGIEWAERQSHSDESLESDIISGKPAEAILIPEETLSSPPKKRHRIYDEERIIMGDQLTDLEINYAQRLLKQQCTHVNGLTSTLLQEKGSNLTRDTVKNRVKIIYCRNHRHWVVATTINSDYNTVKVYDSVFHYLDQDSLQTVESCFQSDVIPEIRMMQCRKQEGVKDCGVYAIAFSVALALGVNPSRQNFKQESMRAHLVQCFRKEHFTLFPCK